jgi:hypothetical protein
MWGAGMKIIDLAFQGLNDDDRLKLGQSRAWSRALVVPETHSATDVAEVVDLNDMNIVVVIDKNDVVKGVVVPDIVIENAPTHLPLASKPKDFAGMVSEIMKHPRHKPGFEWLNIARPQMYWCKTCNYYSSKKCTHPQ